jgi:hypothetical protein
MATRSLQTIRGRLELLHHLNQEVQLPLSALRGKVQGVAISPESLISRNNRMRLAQKHLLREILFHNRKEEVQGNGMMD